MKVAIYSRVMDHEQKQDVQLLFDELSQAGITTELYKPFYDSIKELIHFPSNIECFNSGEELDSSYDFVISLGGDGTLLDPVTRVKDKKIAQAELTGQWEKRLEEIRSGSSVVDFKAEITDYTKTITNELLAAGNALAAKLAPLAPAPVSAQEQKVD